MEIILLRHGKPEVNLNGWVGLKEFEQLAKAYIGSGIKDVPPEKLINYFTSSHCLVCSDLKRSIDSAEKLGFNMGFKMGLKNVSLKDTLFAESAIPYFNPDSFILARITLPANVWLIILRVSWLSGFTQNGESIKSAKNRAKTASIKLIEMARQYGKVILVGHGLMKTLIARQLCSQDWQGPKNPGNGFWQYGVYHLRIMNT